MSVVSTEASSAADQSGIQFRRARRLASAVITVVFVLSCFEHPTPSLAGSGLGVSLAIALLVACGSVLVLRPDSPLVALGLAGLILASSSLVWLQRGGAAEPGLFVAVALAGTHLADTPSLVALVSAAVAYLAPAIHVHRSPGMIAGTELGIIAFYLVARFGRSASEAHERASRLLLELQVSQGAEAQAAMLRERGRLARDMHDVLAHSLSGLMLQLEGARMLAGQPDEGGQLPLALDRAHHLARAGLEEARRAISALRDDEGLPGADRLKQLTVDFEEDSQVRTSLAVDGVPRALDSETSLTIYRVAQEALTNVRRHSTPERVEVWLGYHDRGVRLTIQDHASPPRRASHAGTRTASGGYGLTGMRERAELLGGSLDAHRTHDGFHVELRLPG